MKKLIITIINRGYADELMLAAREVGARGGTIVNARGTVTEDNSEFFGISLTPEKEMLLIIAYADEVSNIVNAIKSRTVFSQRGAGIVFTLNIEEAFFE